MFGSSRFVGLFSLLLAACGNVPQVPMCPDPDLTDLGDWKIEPSPEVYLISLPVDTCGLQRILVSEANAPAKVRASRTADSVGALSVHITGACTGTVTLSAGGVSQNGDIGRASPVVSFTPGQLVAIEAKTNAACDLILVPVVTK